MDMHKMQRMASTVSFLEQYQKDGGISQSHRRVTAHAFVNIENKE
jgi:hypothetical protein